MINALEYHKQLDTLKRQLSAWRIVQYFKGYSAGFHLFTPPYAKTDNEFFQQGYAAGKRDRQLSFEQLDESQFYWSEASVTADC